MPCSRCSFSEAIASDGMLPSCQFRIRQALRAVLRRRYAGLDHDALVGLGRERDRALERHVHGRDPQRAARQHETVHALGDGVPDHVRGVDVGARRQVRAVLLDAARGQDHERIASKLRGDFGLGEVDEVAGKVKSYHDW